MNIILIGFMGTGKSTVGRLLADQLGCEFIDTDNRLAELEGQSIPEIFAVHGEQYFRSLEAALAKSLAVKDRQIIATGGGFPLNPQNLTEVRTNGVIILLKAAPQLIFQRVQSDKNRPLLQVEDPLLKIESLLAVREAFYTDADITVDTNDKEVKEVVGEIVSELERRGYFHGES